MRPHLTARELEVRIATMQDHIVSALAPYEAESAICFWLDTLRAIEEVINLWTIDWEDAAFEHLLFAFPVSQLAVHSRDFRIIRHRLVSRFSEKFANRFCNLVTLASTVASAFEAYGFFEAASGFQSLRAMMGYLQSRRRHFVGLLQFLPHACRGSQRVDQFDTINIFLPIVECYGTVMMGAQYSLMETLAQERLGITAAQAAPLRMLSALYLEPERAPIVEMSLTHEGWNMLASPEPLLPDRLFSAAELRNDILSTEAAYAEFDLGGTEFTAAAALVRRLSIDHIDRDFWIALTSDELSTLLDAVGASPGLRSALVCHAQSYMECLSSYAPLVHLNGRYLSTVTLLSRFVYFWRARVLDRQKRFQIRAGFIFEDAVKQALAKQGFVIQDIVRLNRQEFDVVMIRDQVIWNVQCKNNFIDIDRVDSDASRFARYNHMLVRYYERALVKERNRGHLLKERFALQAIQHMVVSRFPVVTDNLRIVVFNDIDEFASRATVLQAH
jgi:hypothetical protein